MEWKDILTKLAMLLCLSSCSNPATAPDAGLDPFVSDAQYICDVLTDCFGLDLGADCAGEIEATTTAADIARCADCYGPASCEDIGEPGVAGVCDVDCHAALFGGV